MFNVWNEDYNTKNVSRETIYITGRLVMTTNIYDFMHSLDIDSKSVGVDALTITATGLDGKLSVDLVLDELKDVTEKEWPKPFSFQGAKGRSWGSVRQASKWDDHQRQLWTILMVTGKDSPRALKQALKVDDIKYTRIDTYIDVKMSQRVLGLARKLYDTYKGTSSKKLIESETGDTVYFGSRMTESMIRIYDKSKEYNEELGMVWRFEVEYKKDLANGVVQYLSEYGNSGIDELVWAECKSKSLPVPAIPDKVNIMRDMVTLSSAEMKLNWLGRQVMPTVKFLRRLGLEDRVKEVLQLDLPI